MCAAIVAFPGVSRRRRNVPWAVHRWAMEALTCDGKGPDSDLVLDDDDDEDCGRTICCNANVDCLIVSGCFCMRRVGVGMTLKNGFSIHFIINCHFHARKWSVFVFR